TKSYPDVYVEGRLVGHVAAPGSRCNVPAKLDVEAPVQMTFVPEEADEDGDEAGDEEGDEDEVELSSDALDVSTYTDERSDLEPVLREQLMLALPMTQLCREDCKGLCPRCGQDWNQGPCSCPPDARDERFAALRNVKI